MLKTHSVFFGALLLVAFGASNGEKTVSNEPAQQDHLSALRWVETADVQTDAQAAIVKKDYRLFVVATRGKNMPGVPSVDDYNRAEQRCGIQYLPGSTDVVKGEQHLALLQRAYRYAETYNQLMLNHCR